MTIMLFFCEVKECATLQSKGSLKVEDMKDINEFVHAALLKLKDLSVNIKTGAITGKEVEVYAEQINRLQDLYEAANIGVNPILPQFTEISDAIKDSVNILEAVKEYRTKLGVVMDYCKCISEGTYVFTYPNTFHFSLCNKNCTIIIIKVSVIFAIV